MGAAEDQRVDVGLDERLEIGLGQPEQLSADVAPRSTKSTNRGHAAAVTSTCAAAANASSYAPLVIVAVVPMTPIRPLRVASDRAPYRRLDDLDHGHVVPLAGVPEHGGAGGVAGDDQHLDAVARPAGPGTRGRTPAPARWAWPVRRARGVAEVEDALVRQLVDDGPGHGEPADPRVEDPDRRVVHARHPIPASPRSAERCDGNGVPRPHLDLSALRRGAWPEAVVHSGGRPIHRRPHRRRSLRRSRHSLGDAWRHGATRTASCRWRSCATARACRSGQVRWQRAHRRWQSPLPGRRHPALGPPDDRASDSGRPCCGPATSRHSARATAAELNGLRGYADSRVHVLVPDPSTAPADNGIVVHRSRTLRPSELVPDRAPRTGLHRPCRSSSWPCPSCAATTPARCSPRACSNADHGGQLLGRVERDGTCAIAASCWPRWPTSSGGSAVHRELRVDPADPSGSGCPSRGDRPRS